MTKTVFPAQHSLLFEYITDAAHQPSLAPHAGANYIQGGDADVSCTAWFRTTLLGVYDDDDDDFKIRNHYCDWINN